MMWRGEYGHGSAVLNYDDQRSRLWNWRRHMMASSPIGIDSLLIEVSDRRQDAGLASVVGQLTSKHWVHSHLQRVTGPGATPLTRDLAPCRSHKHAQEGSASSTM